MASPEKGRTNKVFSVSAVKAPGGSTVGLSIVTGLGESCISFRENGNRLVEG